MIGSRIKASPAPYSLIKNLTFSLLSRWIFTCSKSLTKSNRHCFCHFSHWLFSPLRMNSVRSHTTQPTSFSSNHLNDWPAYLPNVIVTFDLHISSPVFLAAFVADSSSSQISSMIFLLCKNNWKKKKIRFKSNTFFLFSFFKLNNCQPW